MGQIPHPLGWLVPQWVSHNLNSYCPHTLIHTDLPSLSVHLRQGQPMYPITAGGFRHPYPALAMNASMSRWVVCFADWFSHNAWTLFTGLVDVFPFKFSTPFIFSIKLFKGYITPAIRLRWNGSSDRSFILCCDVHPSVTNYQKKWFWFSFMHRLLIGFWDCRCFIQIQRSIK